MDCRKRHVVFRHFYDFVKGFFGWHNAAENIRVITYFAFLAPTLYFYLRKPVKSAA